MSAKHWHLRTVKDGKVRIRGRWYRPSELHLPYDGRLEGHRFLFATYPGDDTLASLWGSEDATVEDGPEVVDGTLPWIFWHIADATTPIPNSISSDLCLHGQPFGFTWEDVDAIRACASSHFGESYSDSMDDEGRLAQSVADRIAALLPPR